MEMLKQMLFIFLVGLGTHRLVQDALNWIDPELAGSDPGYFSVIGFMIVYFAVKYLKQRDAVQSAKTNTTN